MSKLPRRVVVAEVLNSRYSAGSRPTSWDDRRAGVEIIRTCAGEEIKLFSSGGQSTPALGWEILLMSEHLEAGARGLSWTLYGIKPSH